MGDKNMKQDAPPSKYKSGIFKTEVQKLEWNISKFSDIAEFPEAMKTQRMAFLAGDSLKLNSQWELSLNIKSHEENEESENQQTNKEYLGIRLSRLGATIHPHLLSKLRVGIVSSNPSRNCPIIRRGKTVDLGRSNIKDKSVGWKEFAEMSTLLDPTLGYLDDVGSLTLEVDFTLFWFEGDAYPSHLKVSTIPEQMNNAFHDLQTKSKETAFTSFLSLTSQESERENFPDVNFYTLDDVHFQLHRNILAARSEVFRKNFEDANRLEGEADYEIPLNSEVFKIILQHTYSGELKLEWLLMINLPDIISASKLYGFTYLESFIDRMLHTIATIENIHSLIKLAEEKELKTALGNLKAMRDNFEHKDETLSGNTGNETSTSEENANDDDK